jgi:hypothetical protein
VSDCLLLFLLKGNRRVSVWGELVWWFSAVSKELTSFSACNANQQMEWALSKCKRRDNGCSSPDF